MEEKKVKGLLGNRLHLELQIFRYSIFRKSKREIYDSAYKIELMETIYDILLENIQKETEDTLLHLLWWNGGILELMYQQWLKKDGNSYEALSEHIKNELKLFSKEAFVVLKKEEPDGKRSDKAA